MAIATDAEYNAPFRAIECIIEMYLNGNDAEPLVINRANYLVDMDLLEEACSDSYGPFGNVTSNEVSFTLYNENGMFSPTNKQGPYYGLLRKGVKCNVYFKVEDCDADLVGVFYVTDWQATITGTIATVTADDALYGVLNKGDLKLPIAANVSIATYLYSVFEAANVEASIDSSLTQTLAIAYSTQDASSLLTSITNASMSIGYCSHIGDITVESLVTPKEIRATLSDTDQIISVDASFSISAGYDGASVTYLAPQESAVQDVLRIKEFEVQAGTTDTTYIGLDLAPLMRVSYASLVGDHDAYVSSILANSSEVKVTVANLGEAAQLDMTLRGTVVETTAVSVGDTGDNVLSMSNEFIQSREQADRILQVLRRYAASDMPVITITARGNPLLNLGDKLVAQSDKYNLEFTGILIRQQFAYSGALSSTLTLLDASLLEVT